MQLTANVYVETGYQGANVGYITTERGIVMIESPQRPTDAIEWRRQIQEKGKTIYLINTEGHSDHVTGDFFFDVPVICHEKARESIIATDVERLKEMIAGMDPDGVPLVREYRVNTPTITYSERLTLYLGSHTFHLISTPGHTAGQTSVFIPEERVVFTGDNVNYQSPAFLHEAVPYDWLQSLQRIKEMDVDHIVTGHGEVCDRSYLDEWAEFIQEWIDTVKQAIKQGWSKEEAIDKISPPSRYTVAQGDEFAKMLVRMNVSHLYDVL
jgi:cyclase